MLCYVKYSSETNTTQSNCTSAKRVNDEMYAVLISETLRDLRYHRILIICFKLNRFVPAVFLA